MNGASAIGRTETTGRIRNLVEADTELGGNLGHSCTLAATLPSPLLDLGRDPRPGRREWPHDPGDGLGPDPEPHPDVGPRNPRGPQLPDPLVPVLPLLLGQPHGPPPIACQPSLV